ncbi:hypothetical protein HOK51_05835 [Candidatus Woesearchaeota archaeon]|jgi:hypothetical protein|nr:hypothetical protein [Candidatus Woesearchaeota archaeon]MBT6519350.1 hypothetical protein [Candidatus Woesearchaeota archaeon]MBT7366810.1 hypothetical protein [Candidatus Woesearchaeota archaeon]
MEIIYTASPYETYHEEINKMPSVSGMRLNTISQISEPLTNLISRLDSKIGENKLWIDLKGRQLRIIDKKRTPYHIELTLNHKLTADLPLKVEFNTGTLKGRITHAYEDKAILLDCKWDDIRAGQSLNITHPSLKVEKYLSPSCELYIKAAKKCGVHNYMLSFAEEESDVSDVLAIDSAAKIYAKIETKRGVDNFVENVFPKYKDSIRLIAARGDLLLHLNSAHDLDDTLTKIIKFDSNAILASRLLATSKEKISSQDMSDLFYILRDLKYQSFLIGDGVSLFKPSLIRAINALNTVNSKVNEK